MSNEIKLNYKGWYIKLDNSDMITSETSKNWILTSPEKDRKIWLDGNLSLTDIKQIIDMITNNPEILEKQNNSNNENNK